MGLTGGPPASHSDPMGSSTRAAVVTGASQGLGLAISTALHRAGYDVLLTDVDGDAVAAAAAPLGGWSARLDVRYHPAPEALAQRAGPTHDELSRLINTTRQLATGPSLD